MNVKLNLYTSNEQPLKFACQPEEFQMHSTQLDHNEKMKQLDHNEKMKQLISQRDEAMKREEAALDRLKLQEVQYMKQINELRTLVKKLNSEAYKAPKPPSTVSSYNSKIDKKKDTKTREVRELNKAINVLRYEKQELERRVNNLSQFVESAANLKEQASKQCEEKDKMIFDLRKKSIFANQAKIDESNKRSKLEAELDGLRFYLAYILHKKSDKMRNKAIQTETTIPSSLNLNASKYKTPFSNPRSTVGTENKGNSRINQARAFSSYKANKSAASIWQTKLIEQDFQKQTNLMKQKYSSSITNVSKTDIIHGSVIGNSLTLSQALRNNEQKLSKDSKKLSSSNSLPNQLGHEPAYNKKTPTDKKITFRKEQDLLENKLMSPLSGPPFNHLITTVPKFSQHGKVISPAEVVYNSRISV